MVHSYRKSFIENLNCNVATVLEQETVLVEEIGPQKEL